MLLVLISLAVSLIVLVNDYRRCGYVTLLNPFAWLLLLYILYFVVPSIFSIEINQIYNWGMNKHEIFLAQCLVSIIGMLFSILLVVFRTAYIRLGDGEGYKAPVIIFSMWMFICLYVIWVSISVFSNGIIHAAFMYDVDAAKDPYKLKNIAYLLLPISICIFFHTRRYIAFLPGLIIVVLDLLHGSRTTAFVCIIPLLFCAVVTKRKVYLPQILTMFVIMLCVGIFRSENMLQQVPWYINAMGEFRETYITLPLYINDHDYIANGGFFSYVASIFFGVLQPLRTTILESYLFPGVYIAMDVNRGYGLGSNFLIDSLYYGFAGFVISLLLIILFVAGIYWLISRVKLKYAVILISLFVICIRLIIREGFPINFGLFLFISLIYITPVIFFERVRL